MTTQTAPLCVTTLNEIDDVQIGDIGFPTVIAQSLQPLSGQLIRRYLIAA
jgi:hypothetical protein